MDTPSEENVTDSSVDVGESDDKPQSPFPTPEMQVRRYSEDPESIEWKRFTETDD